MNKENQRTFNDKENIELLQDIKDFYDSLKDQTKLEKILDNFFCYKENRDDQITELNKFFYEVFLIQVRFLLKGYKPRTMKTTRAERDAHAVINAIDTKLSKKDDITGLKVFTSDLDLYDSITTSDLKEIEQSMLNIFHADQRKIHKILNSDNKSLELEKIVSDLETKLRKRITKGVYENAVNEKNFINSLELINAYRSITIYQDDNKGVKEEIQKNLERMLKPSDKQEYSKETWAVYLTWFLRAQISEFDNLINTLENLNAIKKIGELIGDFMLKFYGIDLYGGTSARPTIKNNIEQLNPFSYGVTNQICDVTSVVDGVKKPKKISKSEIKRGLTIQDKTIVKDDTDTIVVSTNEDYTIKYKDYHEWNIEIIRLIQIELNTKTYD